MLAAVLKALPTSGLTRPETLPPWDTRRHFHILERTSLLLKSISFMGLWEVWQEGVWKGKEVRKDKSPMGSLGSGGRDGIQESTDPLPDLHPLKQFP